MKVIVNGLATIGNGSNVNNYLLTYVSPLGPYSSPGGSFFNNVDFQSQKALYDEVCIKSFTVKFNPIVTMSNLYDQGFALTPTQQARLQPNIYTWFDRDSSPLTAVNDQYVNKLAQYDSFKQFNCYKKWSRTINLKPMWLSCDKVAGGSHLTDVTTVPMTQAGLLGNFGIYGQNLPWATIGSSNESYAQVEIHWKFLFRGKRALNISVTDGVVTLTPADKFAPIIQTFVEQPSNDSGGQPLTLDPVTSEPISVLP